MWGAFVLRYPTITQGSLDGSSQERIRVWTTGLKMFAYRPITGVGIYNFGTANAAAFSGPSRVSYLESHSLYVQVPAEKNLVGVIGFFTFLLEILRLNRRTDWQLSVDPEDWSFESALLRGVFADYIARYSPGSSGTRSCEIAGILTPRSVWPRYACIRDSVPSTSP